MKVKQTLNLGKTEFPMRGNLPNREPEMLKEWSDQDLYGKRQELNKDLPVFVLHDGPPYANGQIHMGHALNKISKDFTVRFKSMTGYRAPFVPGWDTHGLPIEQEVTKKGVNRKEMSISEFRTLCREYALSQVELQKNDFKRLGVNGTWDKPYLTMDKEYESAQLNVFGKMVDQGIIFRGKKPVYWSPSSESALAEAEIEYKDVKSPSIYISFDVKDGNGKLTDDTSLIIWTTTPWTIPANRGIAVNPNFEYVQVLADGKKYVVAAELLNNLTKEFDWNEVKILNTFTGRDLEYITVKHPLYPEQESLVILGNHVTLDAGTGLVHTAPGFGEDDYFASLPYKLEVASPVNERGIMTDGAPGFEGQFYDKINPLVTEQLKENGHLIKLDFFTHSYPHDWRTKKPVIYRATPQWFASIDKFRDLIIENVDEVEYRPDWGKKRLRNMMINRGDWVISRQRAWGVPLPIFYGENGEPILDSKVINHVANLFKQYGSNIWYEKTAKELLPDGYKNENSPNGEFTKEKDIMDVWFDSGSSHEAVLRNRKELKFPADLILEGSDQYRGWFNSSMITSVSINGVKPYNKLISQGFVLDGKGRKMSKSLGNTILPNKIVNQMGADIIRLWVSTVDTSGDVRVSNEILQQVSESYRKIRNTMRFMLANIYDYDNKINAVQYNDLPSVDQYMLNLLNEVVRSVRDSYENNDFNEVFKVINNFIINDLSSFYLDLAKDILYIDAKDSNSRRSMQTVIYQILVKLDKLLNPILTFTSEEIWQYLNEAEEFAQLSEMPDIELYENEIELADLYQAFFELRSGVQKSLETAREAKLIGKSLDASVTLYVSDSFKAVIEALESNLQQLFMVSQLKIVSDNATDIESADKYDGYAVKVTAATGEVCERCRLTKTDVGSNPDYPMLCARCAKIVETEFPETKTEGLETK